MINKLGYEMHTARLGQTILHDEQVAVSLWSASAHDLLTGRFGHGIADNRREAEQLALAALVSKVEQSLRRDK